MSAPSQKANLARIRDNQRRSRARRREYIQELEQRLRAFDLQGVEASAEVQMAARRVAEENRQLRELLNRNGFGDDYIVRYLQMGTATPPDSRIQRFPGGDPSSSVQSLQHLIAPRRPAGLDGGIPFGMAGQIPREMSATSASSGSSSTWDPQHPQHPQQHPPLPTYGQHSHVVPLIAASMVPPTGEHHQYTPQMFADEHLPARSVPEPLPPSSTPNVLLHEVAPQATAAQPAVTEHQDQMAFSASMSPFHIPAQRELPLPGPYF